MRIITWNVNYTNKKIPKLLDHAFSHDPDILCLQEVPEEIVSHLKTFSQYHLELCSDFMNFKNKKNFYICTLTKFSPIKIHVEDYFVKPTYSLLSSIYYKKLKKIREQFQSLILTIPNNTTIVNTRLSCAVNPRDRLEQFLTILKTIPKKTNLIITGDLNIPDSQFFQRATGWIRGFTKTDYSLNERVEFEKLFTQLSLQNIFRGIPTMFFSKPVLQLDHILVPTRAKVIKTIVARPRFGSDHRMLLADIRM